MMKGAAIGGACLSLNLRRAARVVSRRYDEALRPIGITVGQFSILSTLLSGQALPISKVADLLGMDRTTLTRNLRPLRRRDLLTSVDDPADRRSHQVALTAVGKALMTEAIPLWEKVQRQNLRRLEKGDWAEVKTVLDRLR